MAFKVKWDMFEVLSHGIGGNTWCSIWHDHWTSYPTLRRNWENWTFILVTRLIVLGRFRRLEYGGSFKLMRNNDDCHQNNLTIRFNLVTSVRCPRTYAPSLPLSQGKQGSGHVFDELMTGSWLALKEFNRLETLWVKLSCLSVDEDAYFPALVHISLSV